MNRFWPLVILALVAGGLLGLIITSGQSAATTPLWVLFVAMFVVVEGKAFLDRDYESTLTAHLRQWFGIEGKPSGWRFRRLLLVFSLAWLAFHLLAPQFGI